MHVCSTCDLSDCVYRSSLPRQRRSQILLRQRAAFRFTQTLLGERKHTHIYTHTHMHTHIHMRTHTLIQIILLSKHSREKLAHYAKGVSAGCGCKLESVLSIHQGINLSLLSLHQYLCQAWRPHLSWREPTFPPQSGKAVMLNSWLHRAGNSHTLAVKHTHFNQFTRSQATPCISHAEKATPTI